MRFADLYQNKSRYIIDNSIFFFSGILIEDENSEITNSLLGITETETKTETNSSSTFAVGAPESDIYGLEITTITGLKFVLFFSSHPFRLSLLYSVEVTYFNKSEYLWEFGIFHF